MNDDNDWKKLPLEVKCQHKSWKARAESYQECLKNFSCWDEGSEEFNKYQDLIENFVTDPNEPARLLGVQAVAVFVEKSCISGQNCGEVISGIVSKCFNSKSKLKKAAVDVCLMYIETGKDLETIEELLKGFSNKQPKVVKSCIETVTEIIRQFGCEVIQPKAILSEIPSLSNHKDKNVREAAKDLIFEISRWIGSAIKSSLKGINSVLLKDLEEAWERTSSVSKPVATRLPRSQKSMSSFVSAASVKALEEKVPVVGKIQLSQPVNILNKLPKKFFKSVQSKQWKERREMLQACQSLCETPNIAPADFSSLVKALTKVISNDNNIMLVIMATKSLAGLAKAIGSKFRPYSVSCIKVLLNKFKDKKPTVIAALLQAVDAVYRTSTLQVLIDTFIEQLKSKNPSIIEQTALFLARNLGKDKKEALDKISTSHLTQALVKNMEHSSPAVRDASSYAVAALLENCSRRAVMPLLTGLDSAKLDKVKEQAKKYSGKDNMCQQTSAEMKAAKPCAMPQFSSNDLTSTDDGAGESVPENAACTASADFVPACTGKMGGSIECLAQGSGQSNKDLDIIISRLAVEDCKVRLGVLGEVGDILASNDPARLDISKIRAALVNCLHEPSGTLILATLNILNKFSEILFSCVEICDKELITCLFALLAHCKFHVRQAAVNALNLWFAKSDLSSWLEKGIIEAAFCASSSTVARSELLHWLTTKLTSSSELTALGKESLHSCLKHLCNCLQTEEADVKMKAQNAVPAFMLHLGSEALAWACPNDNSASMKTAELLLNNQNTENLPIPTTQFSCIPSPSSLLAEDSKDNLSKKSSKPLEDISPLNKQSKQTETFYVLVKVPDGKMQRMKNEQECKTLKWAFKSPNKALIRQLKSQFLPCIIPKFLEELFHTDFKSHIAGISLLTQALDRQWDETIDMLDLILKWISLRFYDGNSAVLVKSLDYLVELHEKLASVSYEMIDYEAEAFIPHLITKIGDPREYIRQKAMAIIDLVLKIYMPYKVFNYLMLGLDTENSRQKVECLMEIGFLITTCGMDVCHPTCEKALGSISAFFTDKDRTIRRAAHSIVIAAFGWCGSAVFDYIGNVDNDTIDVMKKKIEKLNIAVAHSPMHSETFGMNTQTTLTTPGTVYLPTTKKLSIPTTIEHGICKPHNCGAVSMCHSANNTLVESSGLDFLNEEIGANGKNEVNAPDVSALNSIILSTKSDDMDEALKAIKLLREMIGYKEHFPHIKRNIDQIVMTSSIQLHKVMVHCSNQLYSQCEKATKLQTQSVCKYLIALNLEIWRSSELALCVTQVTLENHLSIIATFLLNKQIEMLPNGKRLKLLANLLFESLIDTANATYILCAAIKMVLDALDVCDVAQIDISFRALWRLLKHIPSFTCASVDCERPYLDYASILNEVNRVMKYCCCKESQKSDNDIMALKSMRSLTYCLCKEIGSEILEYAQNVPDVENYGLMDFIIKTLKIDRSSTGTNMKPVCRTLFPHDTCGKFNYQAIHTSPERMIASIVKKFERQKLEEMYSDLCQFMEKYPDYDIEKHFGCKEPRFVNFLKSNLWTCGPPKNALISVDKINQFNDDKKLTAEERFELIKSKRIQYGIPQ